MKSMNKRILFVCIACTCFCCLFTSQASAVSMGVYLDSSSGSGSYQWDDSSHDFDVDTSSGAIGFVLDTASVRSFFNYRLNVGFEGQALEDAYDTVDLGGIYVEHVFGFRFVRQRNLLWWGGPLVRFGVYSGETRDDYYVGGYWYRTEFDYSQFGIGFATGGNFKAGKRVTLSPSFGIRFISASGEGTEINLDTNAQHTEDITGHSTNFFVNFAVLF